MAIVMTDNAARNLPTIACQTDIGIVKRSSIVPVLCSSAHNLIPTAGARNINNHIGQRKNENSNDASCALGAKKSSNKKVKDIESNTKITINT